MLLCEPMTKKGAFTYSLTMSKLRNRHRGSAVIGSYWVRGGTHLGMGNLATPSPLF